MKKVGRIIVLVLLAVMALMTLTACAFTKGKEDQDIYVRWNEKEAYLYTNKTCMIKLKFNVREGNDTVQIEKNEGIVYRKGTISTFKVEELAPGYLTEQAVIQEVNAYRIAIAGWVWVIIGIIAFLILAPKLSNVIEGP